MASRHIHFFILFAYGCIALLFVRNVYSHPQGELVSASSELPKNHTANTTSVKENQQQQNYDSNISSPTDDTQTWLSESQPTNDPRKMVKRLVKPEYASELCQSELKLIHTKVLKQVGWLTVASEDNLTHAVLIRICRDKSKQDSISYTLPLGYQLSCRQEYIRIVSFVRNDTHTSGEFQEVGLLPSGCSAYLELV